MLLLSPRNRYPCLLEPLHCILHRLQASRHLGEEAPCARNLHRPLLYDMLRRTEQANGGYMIEPLMRGDFRRHHNSKE